MAATSPKNSKRVNFAIKANGAALSTEVAVKSIDIIKEVNRIPTARIIIYDGEAAKKDFPESNKDDFKPGSKIEIEAGYDQEKELVFKGIVIKHSIKITRGSAMLIVECKDEAVKMTIGRKNAYYKDKKDNAIISEIIGNYSGLSADVESTTPEQKEVVQYYCTDWDFMLSRAEINGKIVIADDGKVSVKKPDTSTSATLGITYGSDILEFNAEMDARTQYSASQGTSWDMSSQAIVQATGANPSVNSQGNLKSSDLASVVGLDNLNLQTYGAVAQDVLQAWTDAQLMKSWLSRIQGTAKFQGNAGAKPGVTMEVDGVGDRFNGTMYITGVHHEISKGNWTSEARIGLPAAWFSETPDIVAPPASGLLPGTQGLQVGKVKQLDQDPDGETRIMVTFPLMQDDSNGVWARLSNFYATKTAGSFFIPEIDDEVVVGFLNDDPRYPIILGSLYSSNIAAPYTPTADNYTKALVTNSKLEVNFDDEKKVIVIKTPGGNSITLSEDAKSITIEDQNSNKVELGSSGITMDSPKNIAITAKGTIDIDATGTLTISSKADVSVKGLNVNNTANVGFTAKGNASAELSASGQTTVKGAMVMIN
ncbi:MAG: type VI secretion system tip protein VgrG [Bacteroidota bacterium]